MRYEPSSCTEDKAEMKKWQARKECGEEKEIREITEEEISVMLKQYRKRVM